MIETSGGIIEGAQKIVIHGPEGIGKSSLAAMFPKPLVADVEGGTKKINITRINRGKAPSSWTMLLDWVNDIKRNPEICDTFIIDTIDWAEDLCISHTCSTRGKEGIEDFGYGNGYVYLEEDFGKLLNALTELVENHGINVVLIAHSKLKKFEQPDEIGAYDRYEMQLEKKTGPLVKQWADTILFINYKTYVVSTGKDGKGAKKAQGGNRVIYTTHHPCWDAKNRDGLPEELSFSSPEDGWKQIAHCIPPRINKTVNQPKTEEYHAQNLDDIPDVKPAEQSKAETSKPETAKTASKNNYDGIPDALYDLMFDNEVTPEEIQQAVAGKGYYPVDTPIKNYDPGFINGVLVGAWPQVFAMIQNNRRM